MDDFVMEISTEIHAYEIMNCMIDITRCPLTLILTKTQRIPSNMKKLYEDDKKVCLIWSTHIQG